MIDATIGQVIWSAVKPIIKIYLIIGTGFLLAKRNILTVETTRNLSDIILSVLLPCLVFNKIVSNIEDSDIKNVGIICLSSVIIFGTGGLCGVIVKLTSPVPKKWLGGLMAGAIFPNISDIPIAYLQTLDTGLVFTEEEGNKGIAHVCIFLAMFTLCLFNIGGFRLIEYDFRDILKPVIDEENQNEKLQKRLDSGEPTRVPTVSDEEAIEDDDDDDDDDDNDDETSSSDREAPKDQNPVALTNENHQLHRRNTIDQQELRVLRNRQRRSRRRASSTSTRSNLSRIPTGQSSQMSTLSYYSRMRTPDIRRMPSQTVDDIVNEYSEIDRIQEHPSQQQLPRLSEVLTTDVGVTGEDIQNSGPPFLKKYHLGIVAFFLKNCLRPCAASLIASLTIAFIPWVKALFVKTTVYMPDAPDELPPLNFIMDYTSYVGAASVPFALILLGGSIARLKLGRLFPGFWRASLLLVVLRLCVMPILGVLWVNRLVSAGWIGKDDHMLMFVIMVSWALPSMTTQIYFTAFYTPLDAEDRTQMDCASVYLLMQYPVMLISLPFLVTYIVKVQFK